MFCDHFGRDGNSCGEDKFGDVSGADFDEGSCKVKNCRTTMETIFKNLLMPLFLMGCFPVDFQEVKRPLRTTSVKRPIKVGKRPINEGKRPIKAMVLVGISVGCLMGCFRTPPPWRKMAPLKRPIKRSMVLSSARHLGILQSNLDDYEVRRSSSRQVNIKGSLL